MSFAACRCGSFVRVCSDFSFQPYSTSCENRKCPHPGWEGLCKKTRRIFAPTVRSWSRVWGRHSPTRMTEWTEHFQELKICGHGSILAFAVSVQHSKMSFIEPHSTFTVWQAQCENTGRPCSWSPFTPNAVPAPVLQRRLSGSLAFRARSWLTVSRSDGL